MKGFAFFVSAALAVASVKSSNIQDAYYNQNIESILELEQVVMTEGHQIHSRVRRDDIKVITKKNFTRAYELCCKANLKASHSNASYVDECYNRTIGKHIFKAGDFHNNDTHRRLKLLVDDIVCYDECLLSEKYKMSSGIFDQLKQYLSATYNGTWIAPLSETIAAKCSKQYEENSIKYKNQTKYTCNPKHFWLDMCIQLEAQLNCPADQKGNPERCKYVRIIPVRIRSS